MTIHSAVMAPHLTAVGSGKGGTGKTLVAVSLAHALAHQGERVLLCDADLGLSNTLVHLGLDEGGDLIGVVDGTRALSDAVVPVLGGLSIRGGFDLLAPPSGSGALANLDEDGRSNLIAALKAATKYDRVVLDLGAGVDAGVMRFASVADETLLVLTPDPAALTDAYAFAKLLLKANTARAPLVLVNMAAHEAEGRRTAEALSATCRAFLKHAPEHLGTIPRDPRALDAVRKQCQLLTLYPQSPAARAVEAIARRLHARLAPAPATRPNERVR